MNSWYLLYCKRAQLDRAVQHLEQQSVHCYYPSIMTEKLNRGKRILVKEPLFPNYLFINFNPQDIHTTTIAATRGVSHFIRFGTLPAIVPCELIDNLKRSTEAYRACTTLPSTGDTVEITMGVFQGLEAIFHEPDGDTRSILLINMLGQEVKKTISNSEFVKRQKS